MTALQVLRFQLSTTHPGPLTEMTALGSPAFQSSLGSRRLSLSSFLIPNPAVACQLSVTERYPSLKLLSRGRLSSSDLPRQPSGKSTHLSRGFHTIQIGLHPLPSINTWDISAQLRLWVTHNMISSTSFFPSIRTHYLITSWVSQLKTIHFCSPFMFSLQPVLTKPQVFRFTLHLRILYLYLNSHVNRKIKQSGNRRALSNCLL